MRRGRHKVGGKKSRLVIAEWQKLGAVRDRQAFPLPDATAKLWVPVPGGPAFLLGPNFYAVHTYNPSMITRSRLCVLATAAPAVRLLCRAFPAAASCARNTGRSAGNSAPPDRARLRYRRRRRPCRQRHHACRPRLSAQGRHGSGGNGYGYQIARPLAPRPVIRLIYRHDQKRSRSEAVPGKPPMSPPRPAAWRRLSARSSLIVSIAAIERPNAAGANAPGFGSDVVADTLRALDIPYIAVTPGASYRGLHDSIVNYLGNTMPQMLLGRLALRHEQIPAVAIAHGWRKSPARRSPPPYIPMSGCSTPLTAMFNAWCDRMPVVVLGATGPVDAMKRRPWIDWIHTARDQAHSSAATPNGTISRRHQGPRAKRSCAALGSPTPRRKARSISISTPDAGGKAHRAVAADRRRPLHAGGHDRRARRSHAQTAALLKSAKQPVYPLGPHVA